jgi:transcriptional regulator with XRE-family HTH domain
MSRIASDEVNIEIGERLAAIRAVSGENQQAFAESLGLSPRAYANYERGEREMPVVLFRSLHDRYGVDPIWLLKGPGDAPVRASQRRIDMALLEQVIRIVEEGLLKARKALKPEKKARVIRLAYEHCAEQGAPDTARIREMLSLAA